VQYSADFKVLTGANDTTLILEREGQDPVRLDETQDLVFLSFDVDSPTPINNTGGSIPGSDGVQDRGGTTYGSRNMVARFMLVEETKYNLALLKTNVLRLFDSKKPFSIIDEDNPGRRWKDLRLSDRITFEDKGPAMAIATIPMVAFMPYAFSIGSLIDPFTIESELWQFSQNIPFEDAEGNLIDFSYEHTETEFSIWNLGDAVIDPRFIDLMITYKGASSGLTITNETTGDEWHYNGDSGSGDIITLDGVFSRKNGSSIFGDTSHKLITLAPGENKFKLTGTQGSFEISFDLPFLYL
jgi:hypothetical protein